MSYIVLVGAGVALVGIWIWFFRQSSGDLTSGLVRVLIGSAFCGWLIWDSVQTIQAQNAQAIREEIWLETFVEKHKAHWDEDCRGVLTDLGAQGVLYDPADGRALTLAYCQSMWQAPQRPSEYSSYDFEQPDKVPPFMSVIMFGDGDSPSEVRCVDRELTMCYDWMAFRGPPDLPGW